MGAIDKKHKSVLENIMPEKKCPVCGSVFIVTPVYVYRVGSKYMCSWNCLCQYRREQGEKKQTRNIIGHAVHKTGWRKEFH